MSMSCCMREAMETAQSPDDDNHAVGTRPKWARAPTTHFVCSNVSVGCEPGLSTCAQTRTRANVNIGPRPLAQRTGKEKKRKRIREREKERKMERDKQTKRQREKEREGRRRDRGEKERRVTRLQIFLKIRSPGTRWTKCLGSRRCSSPRVQG